ncbi:hypothetical protein PHYBLDRAFT_166800 [Phycomyces blakesleeanus NRRL 1555(-)]|uniref:Uncharacterized protein n=1 Tax=Phycomyces blakesleeanus (strain ATCC 8743b / DSM 1359 / FGSC 10004 / NBRC 33097 / NRRL 1555) TaxID=763407 RepID=A0A162PYV2_PHYB8|nr:hypothetical protein PHYBLDRAFT_166800 [Phycomyces blakesleeanus NRRL 1555(-)]OAD75566.1 hypothetical protein PHYBLDRAFT_166800 [Phycomyces blakesleeanus NRRL 1555(-)]|eukprot:XP_018293606.1 hypothetical protein PHYBLDRAFT_166800 [Phycomyces blakesleeanus NRRL 1555(-)]
MLKYSVKQQTVAALKKLHKIRKFVVKKKKSLVQSLSTSADELLKNISEVLEEEVDAELEKIAVVEDLEQNLQVNRYLHKGGNTLPKLKLKEEKLAFLKDLDADEFKEEIRMFKSSFNKLGQCLKLHSLFLQVNLSLEGIKMLPFKVGIPVKASEWRRCLDQSNTLCSTKWNKKIHLDSKEYIFGETCQWHRAVIYIPERDSCPAQKESKACECNGALKIKQFKKSPTIITLCMTRDHNNHVPEDRSEIRTLLLPFEAIKLIEDQLRSGNSCRSTRISVL